MEEKWKALRYCVLIDAPPGEKGDPVLAKNYQPKHPITPVPLDEMLWGMIAPRPKWDRGLDDNDRPWLVVGLMPDCLIVTGYTCYGGDDEGGTRVAELKLAAPLSPELTDHLIKACFKARQELRNQEVASKPPSWR